MTEENDGEDLQRTDEAVDADDFSSNNDILTPSDHFIAASNAHNNVNGDSSTANSTNKKIPTPSKKNSVARILEGKLEELKKVFKREARYGFGFHEL